MVAGAPLAPDGRVADRRIGAHGTGQGIEAGFIDEEEDLPVGVRPLFRAGQISGRHWTIAAAAI